MSEAAATTVAAPAAAPAAPVEAPATPAPEAAKPLPTSPHARRRAIIDTAKERVTAKEAEVKAAKANGAAAPVPANDATPAPAATPPAPPPEGELSKENEKWLRSEMLRNPAAVHTFNEMLKHKTLPEAFIALKKLSSASSANRRAAEAQLAEAKRLTQTHEEWEKLRREKPLEFIKKAGVSIRELAELEASAEPEEKRALRELREEVAALRKERDEQKEQDRERAEQAAITESIRETGAKYAETKEFYPNLAKFEAKAKRKNPGYDVGQQAWNYWKTNRDNGIELDLDTILSTFEEEAASFFEDEQPPPPEQKTLGPSARGNGAGTPAAPAKPVEASTSLSSKLTSERGGPAPPPANRREVVARAWAAAQQARSGNK